ncbi:riboflavin synthase [Rapidithrix thailandica]|uniref:Riboflavin synthase n=1 Tax=Rapidithrix thailandica TaxID=413964 RepID=A0AAW9S2W3_9BACT
MFTGIIECTGKILSIEQEEQNSILRIQSDISSELKIDQSVSHNGVCLTVTSVDGNTHTTTAIHETLEKASLGEWKVGDEINLERCMPMNGRFDGHIVQGHVDQVGICEEVQDEKGSWRFTISYDPALKNITVEKGSICVNGISLTVVDSQEGRFSVAIIPYTFEHTNFKTLQEGQKVNLEFDILGKYIQKLFAQNNYLSASQG